MWVWGRVWAGLRVLRGASGWGLGGVPVAKSRKLADLGSPGGSQMGPDPTRKLPKFAKTGQIGLLDRKGPKLAETASQVPRV